MKDFLLVFFCIFLFLFGTKWQVFGDRIPYSPNQEGPISEQWRWSKLEALESYYLYAGIEDLDGNLLFASTTGLVRYNGIENETIPYPPKFNNTEIHDIHTTATDEIYVATAKGIIYFAKNKWNEVIQFNQNLANAQSMFAEADSGILYAATNIGLYRLDSGIPTLMSEPHIKLIQIEFDSEGNLWMVERSTGKVTRIPTYDGMLSDKTLWTEYDLSEDEAHNPQLVINKTSPKIWAVNPIMSAPPKLYNPKKKRFEPTPIQDFNQGHGTGVILPSDKLLLVSKSSSSLQTYQNGNWREITIDYEKLPVSGTYMFQRSNGNLIIGGRGESVYQIDLSGEIWESYNDLHFQCTDIRGNDWFLTIDKEVIERDCKGNFYLHKSQNLIDSPVQILAAKDGTIWASGSHNNSAAVSYKVKSQWNMDIHPSMNQYFSYLSGQEMSNEEIWFGGGYEVISQIGGLTKYKRDGSSFTYEYAYPPTVPPRIVSIAELSPNNVFFGGLGLYRFDGDQTLKVDFENLPKVRWIDHAIADKSGNLWLALWEFGVFKYDGSKWERYESPQNLASNQAIYLLPDSRKTNALWIATQGGLSYFDGKDWIPQVLPREFPMSREGGTLKQSCDGAIWINLALREWYFEGRNFKGFSNGLKKQFKTIRFAPDIKPPSLTLNPIKTNYVSPANIYLKWEATDAWSKTERERISYSWQVNGGKWSEFAHQTELILLDQKPGKYEVKVVARDLSGNRTQAISFETISVIPPVWQRPWFLLLLVAIGVILAILIYSIFHMRVRQIVQFEDFKIQFFTNMSHELCTPLTVIMTPLQKLLNNTPEGVEKRPIELAFRNATKMLHTIEQILDFRKAEQGKQSQSLFEGDIIRTINESIELVRILAEEKQQKLILSTNKDHYFTSYDADKITKIFDNLVSNSIKYTPVGGKIEILCDILETDPLPQLNISVEDDGIGIPDEKLKRIFDPFYRARDQKNFHVQGTGLGLALTKRLVEGCGGKIAVETPTIIKNDEKRGTRFLIEIPLLPKIESLQKSVSNMPEAPTEQGNATKPSYLGKNGEIDHPIVLVVEDDEDIQEILSIELSEYQIKRASNGKEGFDAAKEFIPDIIISDVMMPEISGLELCKFIKSDPETSHIPVILLTALKGPENELTGLEHGADDYITKPFDVHLFKKKIELILENRRQLQVKYSEAASKKDLSVSALKTLGVDEDFLAKAHAVTMENLSNPLFDIQSLSNELNMSRMTLYRKFRALTGNTPSHFVKLVRMKKAAELLGAGDHSITQIAEKVGIPVSAQFSSTFKKHFSCTPTQYAKRRRA